MGRIGCLKHMHRDKGALGNCMVASAYGRLGKFIQVHIGIHVCIVTPFQLISILRGFLGILFGILYSREKQKVLVFSF